MPETRDVLARLCEVALPRLLAYGTVLTGNREAGEDLVQQAMVKSLARPRRLESLPAAEGYVRAAMRTLHLDGLRREAVWRRLVPRVAHLDIAPAAPEPDDAVTYALAGLSARVRAAVALHYLDDLSVAQTAALMGITPSTTKTYLRDGRAALAEALGTDGSGEVETERIDVKARRR